MDAPSRQTHRLRLGRVTQPGSCYFVTWVTQQRAALLTSPDAVHAVHAAFHCIHKSNNATILCATVMPDHVHALLVLGDGIALGRVIAKIKHLGRPDGGALVRWQDGFFDHRLRPADSIEDYALYILLNPYRAGLLSVQEAWQGWWCPEPATFACLALCKRGPVPRPEWIDRLDLEERIVAGD